MQWYYSKNGTQLGPVEESELRSKIASGEVSSTDLVWKEGMTDWLPSARVPDLAGPGTAVASSAAPVPPAYGGVPDSPYSSPTAPPSNLTGAEIPNYLWQSIVVTIFCCWPFGIPAIVFAAKVDGLKARGDIAGAMAASKSAKMWCTVAVGIWIVLVILWLLLAGLGAVFSNQQ